MRAVSAGVCCLLAVATASCGSDSRGGTAGMGGAEAASFTEVYGALFPRSSSGQCDMCHALPAHDVVNGMLETGMTKESAYEALVDKTSQSSRCMSLPMVMPGKPETSLFYLKLLPDPPCGVRMPNGGRPLSDDQLEMVRSWIAAGAPND